MTNVKALDTGTLKMQQSCKTMRHLTDHQTNDANCDIEIIVKDEPGAGGASHEYEIIKLGNSLEAGWNQRVSFQNGPIKEKGVNGVTQEALLAIVIDRLRSFQKGPYSCRENAIALTKCEEAVMWLNSRTSGRVARGVEGTLII